MLFRYEAIAPTFFAIDHSLSFRTTMNRFVCDFALFSAS